MVVFEQLLLVLWFWVLRVQSSQVLSRESFLGDLLVLLLVYPLVKPLVYYLS